MKTLHFGLTAYNSCASGSTASKITGASQAHFVHYIFELMAFNFRIFTEYEVAQILTNYYDPTLANSWNLWSQPLC
jgi:hypothetical protein